MIFGGEVFSYIQPQAVCTDDDLCFAPLCANNKIGNTASIKY